MTNLDYWEEAVSCALDEVGITTTKEQLLSIAENIECSHENIGQAFYQPENPLISQMKDLERKKDQAIKDKENEIEKIRGEIAHRFRVDVGEVHFTRDGITVGTNWAERSIENCR